MLVRFTAATLLLAFAAFPATAMIFPHLDYSAHLEHGRPGTESFGTLIDAPPTPAPAPSAAEQGLPRVLTPRIAAAVDHYQGLLDRQAYAEAVQAAHQLLETVAAELGSEDVEYAYALSDLGAAYFHNGQFGEAVRPLERSIHGISARLGVHSPVLIGPLAYLGLALKGMEEHDRALDELTRAQALVHRHYGAMSPRQLKLVYAKADILEAKEEYWEAEQMLRLGLRVQEHNHGVGALETMPARYYLAEWLTAIGEYRPALSLYRDAMLALQTQAGEDSPLVVPALRGMAATFLLQQDVDVDRGLTLHQRIADITEQHPDAFTTAERAEAWLDLGDWLILFEREEEAWDAYARAWELAAGDDSRDWAAYLSEPRLIYAGPNLTVDFMGYQVVNEEVWYDFDFRVRPDGRPSHVKVIDSNLSTLTRTRAISFLRKGRFRPAIVDGEPQTTHDYRIRRYYPTTPPEGYGEVIVGGGIGRTPMTHFERRWPGRR